MLAAVDMTSIVVRTRVMSSLSLVNVPLLRFPPGPADDASLSSSSAISRTFQGYSVVMAISAA